jgi:hypothetical protein
VLANGAVDQLQDAAGEITKVGDAISRAVTEIGDELRRVQGAPARATTAPRRSPRPVPDRSSARQARGSDSSPASVAAKPEPAPAADGDFAPSPTQRRILDALAALEAIGIPQASKTQLALFAGMSPKSSTYTNHLGALRSGGLIDYPVPGMAALTEPGRAIADDTDAPSTEEELHRFVAGLVGPSRMRIIDALIPVYPNALPKEELAERAGASPGSSTYTNNLGSLRSLGLIDYPEPGWAAATPVLFLEA